MKIREISLSPPLEETLLFSPGGKRKMSVKLQLQPHEPKASKKNSEEKNSNQRKFKVFFSQKNGFGCSQNV